MMTGFTVSAEEGCKIAVEDTAAAAGGTVRVAVNIENNPGMAIGKLKIGFDKEKLTPSAVEKGDALKSAWQFTSNIDDPNIDASELDYITVSWMNMTDITGGGQLAVVEFSAKAQVSGSTQITVEISELANAAQQNITADAVQGTVTFTGGDDNTDESMILAFSATTVEKTDTAVSGAVNVSVYSENAVDAVFVYAIYDDNGLLKAVRVKDRSLKSGANEVALGELSVQAEKDRAYAVKVYMWDSIQGMRALAQEPLVRVYQ